MVEFSTTGLDNITELSEEEVRRYFEKQVARFHHHADGTPVHLERLEEESGIEYHADAPEQSVSEPRKVPFRYGCNCGEIFVAEKGEIHEETGRDEYQGQDSGYSQEQDSGYKT